MATGVSSSKKQKRDLTPEGFEQLLGWLDRDRDSAGYRYEEIRSRLIKIFVCRGCPVPEELADETINRVAGKVEQVAATYVGNPALYFCGVADKVFLEYTRKRIVQGLPAPVDDSQQAELRYACLEDCMRGLSANNRKLIMAYYGDDGRSKIDRRKHLAEEIGIGANALWIRAHRIREILRKCVQRCIETRQLRIERHTSGQLSHSRQAHD